MSNENKLPFFEKHLCLKNIPRHPKTLPPPPCAVAKFEKFGLLLGMPSHSPAATLGVGAAAHAMGGPWVSIDAARAARARNERRHERKRGPSVAELTLQQHTAADDTRRQCSTSSTGARQAAQRRGGWMSCVSLGWLPASYLRLMPAFYRGVSPVIDHDRSSPPGLNGHLRGGWRPNQAGNAAAGRPGRRVF